MAKIDPTKWYERNSRRTGIPSEQLKKAFHDEIEGEPKINDPLEIPDKIHVLYKYSYGRQSRFFREIRDNKALYGAKCTGCGLVYCPPRANCPKCYNHTEWVPLSGKGTIVTYTSVYATTSEHIKRLPFVCAYVKLDGTDFVMMTNIEMDDISRAKPGMRVEVVFREERDGRISDLYFRPI